MELQTRAYPIQYQRGWDHIFGKYQGSIFLVPTEAESVIFQYDPQITISCILPSKERSIQIEYPKEGSSHFAKILFPTLLLHHHLINQYESCYIYKGSFSKCFCDRCVTKNNLHPITCFCDNCKDLAKSRYHDQFSMYYLDSQKGIFNWNFANVTNGEICFGNQKLARNIRRANANFWGSPFNNSNGVATLRHRSNNCPAIAHYTMSSNHHEHQDHQKAVCRRKLIHTCLCDCPNKDLHHPFLCRGCACPCRCDCCLKQCKCVCNCHCCRKVCNCPCKCDMRSAFIEFLHQQAMKPWTPIGYDNGQEKIFGHQYLKSTEYCEGVFVSHLDSVISKVETPLINKAGNKFVAGFARQIPDQEWEVKLGHQTFLFADKEIHLV